MLREEVISDSAWINTIFDACVDLLLWGGDLIGMTYYEINVWFFCIIWPVFTFGLMIVSGLLFFKLKKLKQEIKVMEIQL